MGFLDFLFKKQGALEGDLERVAAGAREKAAHEAITEAEKIESEALKEAALVKSIVGNGALDSLKAPEGGLNSHAQFAADLKAAAEEARLAGPEAAGAVIRLRAVADRLSDRVVDAQTRLGEIDGVVFCLRECRELEKDAERKRGEAVEKKTAAEAAARDCRGLKAKREASIGLLKAKAEANEARRVAGLEKEKLFADFAPLERSLAKLARFSPDKSIAQLAQEFAVDPVEAYLKDGGEQTLKVLLNSLRTMPGEESTIAAVDLNRLIEIKGSYAELTRQAAERERDALPLGALENEIGELRRLEEKAVKEANAAADRAEGIAKALHEKRFELKGRASAALGVQLADA